MLSLLKRNRRTLLLSFLLLYPFASFLVSRGRAREPHAIDRAVLWVSELGQSGLTSLWLAAGNSLRGYLVLRHVYDDNVRLVAENFELKATGQLLRETQLENDRLRKLLGYAEANPGVKVAARVLGVNPVATLLSLRIDRGENDGVRRGMPVVTPDGVVGHVVRTTGSSGDVLLVSDPNSRVGARIERSRARATAAGSGPNQNLRLDNALRTDDVIEGDVVVTSGADGVFPSGLRVGKVIAVQKKTTGMFQEAQIVPAVDPTKLEEVFVLVTPLGPSSMEAVR